MLHIHEFLVKSIFWMVESSLICTHQIDWRSFPTLSRTPNFSSTTISCGKTIPSLNPLYPSLIDHNPSEKYEFVSWDDYSQYMENVPKCSKLPTSFDMFWFMNFGWKDRWMYGWLDAWIARMHMDVYGCMRHHAAIYACIWIHGCMHGYGCQRMHLKGWKGGVDER